MWLDFGFFALECTRPRPGQRVRFTYRRLPRRWGILGPRLRPEELRARGLTWTARYLPVPGPLELRVWRLWKDPTAGQQPGLSPPPEGRRWTQIVSLSGKAKGPFEGQSPPFRLTGAPARLRYMVRGQHPGLSVWVVAEGERLGANNDYGEPKLATDEEGIGERGLAEGPGGYYLQVRCSDGTWNVAVDEAR